jgi:hypothetical protein
MASDANTIILLPTPWLHEGSWLERLYEELLMTGTLADVKEATGVSVDEDLLYHILMWRCIDHSENLCPAIIITLDGQVILLKLSSYADRRYVELYDLRKVLIEEIEGLERHADCDLAGYVC